MSEKLSYQNVKISQAVEFEAIPFQHTIRIPDCIADGVAIRVLLLFDDTKMESDCRDNATEKL
jgi:hypothetical protein